MSGVLVQTTELRHTVHTLLQAIAPEVDPAALDAAAPLRDQIDLDSMDYLNFILGLHEKLKVEIPESDYRKLVSLDDIVNYLSARIPS